jgi:hypothetical protein
VVDVITLLSSCSDGVSSGACVCAANSAHVALNSCNISSGCGAGVFVCGKATACITATAVTDMVSYHTINTLHLVCTNLYILHINRRSSAIIAYSLEIFCLFLVAAAKVRASKY